MRPRHLLPIVCALLCTAPLPALDWFEARHLLARTGFAPTVDEIKRLMPLSRAGAVDLLLGGVQTVAQLPAPEWCNEDLGEHLRRYREEYQAWKQLEPEERRAKQEERRRKHRRQTAELRAWWLREMALSSSPLTERLVLFWHNHFTTEIRVIYDPLLIYEQQRLFREHALGNFGRFCLAIPYDPAMFRYLDSDSNVRGRPNENFAREVMELFTLGEGHYSETDIKEAARAFSGYKLDPETGRPTQRGELHDYGIKRVLGHQGSFDAEGVITVLLLKEEQVALYITRKFWREFVSPEPDEDRIFAIAARFYKSRYDLEVLLRELLLCEKFWAEEQRGVLIKSPVELLVGGMRQLGVEQIPEQELSKLLRRMGQELFQPPNVKGWRGHRAWISTESIIARSEAMQRLIEAPIAATTGHWLATDQAQRTVELVMLPVDPVIELDDGGATDWAKQLVFDPGYQLK